MQGGNRATCRTCGKDWPRGLALITGEDTRDTLAAQPSLDGCPACDPKEYR